MARFRVLTTKATTVSTGLGGYNYEMEALEPLDVEIVECEHAPQGARSGSRKSRGGNIFVACGGHECFEWVCRGSADDTFCASAIKKTVPGSFRAWALSCAVRVYSDLTMTLRHLSAQNSI